MYDLNYTQHFAWLPKYVKTWRPQGTTAIIWLQKYYQNREGNYCNHLGFFSYEFYR